MQQRTDEHIFVGLQIDTDPLKQKPAYLVDAHNIRLTARNQSTELAITNEKGTTLFNCSRPLLGEYVGHTILNKYLVVFTTEGKGNPDHIYRVDLETKEAIDLLDELVDVGTNVKTLNFSVEHPIEAFSYYEAQYLQKVYWTDNYNQPRVINITHKELCNSVRDNFIRKYKTLTAFDFVPTLQLNEDIEVTKEYSTQGFFPSGTIQYAVSYYNKYGSESNIAWVSPLYYISPNDRGAAPDENVSNIFKLIFKNYDSNFDYLRIYSILRTSLDGTPRVKIVGDLALSSNDINYNINTEGSQETVAHPSLVWINEDSLLEIEDTLKYPILGVKWPISSYAKYYIVEYKEEYKTISFYTVGEASRCIKKTIKWPQDATLYISEPAQKTGEGPYRYRLFFRNKFNTLTEPIEVSSKEEIYIPAKTVYSNIRINLEGNKGYYQAYNINGKNLSNLKVKSADELGIISTAGDYLIIDKDTYPNAVVYIQDGVGNYYYTSFGESDYLYISKNKVIVPNDDSETNNPVYHAIIGCSIDSDGKTTFKNIAPFIKALPYQDTQIKESLKYASSFGFDTTNPENIIFNNNSGTVCSLSDVIKALEKPRKISYKLGNSIFYNSEIEDYSVGNVILSRNVILPNREVPKEPSDFIKSGRVYKLISGITSIYDIEYGYIYEPLKAGNLMISSALIPEEDVVKIDDRDYSLDSLWDKYCEERKINDDANYPIILKCNNKGITKLIGDDYILRAEDSEITVTESEKSLNIEPSEISIVNGIDLTEYIDTDEPIEYIIIKKSEHPDAVITVRDKAISFENSSDDSFIVITNSDNQVYVKPIISILEEIYEGVDFKKLLPQYRIYCLEQGEEIEVSKIPNPYEEHTYYSGIPVEDSIRKYKDSNQVLGNINYSSFILDPITVEHSFNYIEKLYLPLLSTSVTTNLMFIDDGKVGNTIDPTSLIIGKQPIKCETFIPKDGTLFIGNYTLDNTIEHDLISSGFAEAFGNSIAQSTREVIVKNSGVANSENTLDITDSNGKLTSPKTFKKNEYYRLGIQFQDDMGKWSTPIFLKDVKITSFPQETNITPGVVGNNTYFKLPMLSLKVNLRENQVSTKYKKVRPLIVQPTQEDRTIICQGIACPTVFNITDRNNNTPFVQSSWFIRPYGTKLEYRDRYPLSSHIRRGAEIQGVANVFHSIRITDDDLARIKQNTDAVMEATYYGIHMSPPISNFETTAIRTKRQLEEKGNPDHYSIFKEDLRAVYYVDGSIVTIHSPDIEFNGFLNIKGEYTINYVGTTVSNTRGFSHGHMQLQLASVGISRTSRILTTDVEGSLDYSSGMYGGYYYADSLVDDNQGTDDINDIRAYGSNIAWMVYPWQRTGSINNDYTRDGRTSVIKKKVFSNIRSYKETSYVNSPLSKSNVMCQLYNAVDDAAIKINNHFYYGSIDTAVIPPTSYGAVAVLPNSLYEYRQTHSNAKDVVDKLAQDSLSVSPDANLSYLTFTAPHNVQIINSKGEGVSSWSEFIGDGRKELTVCQEAIRIKYKSTPHIVADLGEPVYPTYYTSGGAVDIRDSYLRVVDIVKSNIDKSLLYGGKSSTALKNNTWIPAGEAVSIIDKGETTIEWLYGDTYYQRYDCLKTYPFSPEDVNQVVDIASFMCESRVNIDGRYDKNRGLTDNSNVNPENFNKRNSAYDQMDNYFNYKILDEDFYNMVDYPCSYIWSLQKNPGAEVDTWTSVTLAAQTSLEGKYGSITAIRTLNDKLLAFQEKALSVINFNSRVQIPTSNGAPIEITNNYKVDGHTLVNANIGCINKFSIVTTSEGLYFIDSQTNDFHIYGANGLNNLSKTLYMSSWFKSISNKRWINNTGVKVFIDGVYNDIYIINSEGDSLVYSERLKQFTSFMDYSKALSIFNNRDNTFAISKTQKGLQIWSMFSGEYNNILGNPVSYSISFHSNAIPTSNKIFSNIEIRGDWFNEGTLTNNNEFFNTLLVDNEYQTTGEVLLTNNYSQVINTNNYRQQTVSSNLRKKFRIWRINIPRNEGSRDRINNMWARITLANNSHNNTQMALHDLSVIYYV